MANDPKIIDVRLRTVDLADRKNPDKSGRYVYLTDLMVAWSEILKGDDPIREMSNLLLEVAKKK